MANTIGPISACAGRFPELRETHPIPKSDPNFVMPKPSQKKRRMSPTHKTDAPARRPDTPYAGRLDGPWIYL
jgi:hypothetical protein